MLQYLKKLSSKFWKLSDDFEFQILHFHKSKPFIDINPNFLDKAVNEAYIYDSKEWYHYEYVKKLEKRIIIEPDFGYCITDFNKLITTSVFYPNLKPSMFRYLISFFKNNSINLTSAILFDGQVGGNYFHFFSDIFNKLWLIKSIDNYLDIPLIIGEKTYNTKYFQHLLINTEIKKFKWIVQKKNQYINLNELFFIRPMPYKKEYFEITKKLLNLEDSFKVNRRVFLNRSIKSGRYIENFKEIKKILDKYNFEIVDTTGTTLEFQANLFNSINYLVSIHGAGETNIIFANKQLNFLEINPLNRIACQYYWLAIEMGIAYYDVVLGDSLPETHVYPEKGFYLEPEKFESAIIKMLNKI